MPEAKHYEGDLLDSCYLYTLDEKFTESVKLSFGKGALDEYKVFLKPEYRSFTLISEYKTDVPYPRDAKLSLKVIHKYFEKKYHITGNTVKNKKLLEAHGYSFSEDIIDYTKSGSVSALSKENIAGLNDISIHEALSTHKHGKKYHHCVAEIGYKVTWITTVPIPLCASCSLRDCVVSPNFLKQLFVAVSFVAGKEIIKYIIAVMNYGEYWAISKFSIVLLKKITTMKEAEMWSAVFGVTKGLVNILSYALLLIVYLSIISRKFVRKDYHFKIHEYTFLVLPNVSALCISITLKILIFTVENGMTAIMFDKVPATMFWVPLICFLLLGVNMSSVMLFQKLVQLGEEERKRAIYENQMVQMQREIEEIQDIYADMRGLRHDLKNHLESIAAVIRRISGKDKDKLDNYMEKMETTVGRLDFAYRTGNPITIEAENDFLSEIIFDSETGLPVSSKAEKQLHGLGMENIQSCAKSIWEV